MYPYRQNRSYRDSNSGFRIRISSDNHYTIRPQAIKFAKHTVIKVKHFLNNNYQERNLNIFSFTLHKLQNKK